MSEFMYYEVAKEAVTPALRKRLLAIADLSMRQDAKRGSWLVRSPTPVPNFKGRRTIKEERWLASQAPKLPAPAPVMSAGPNLISLAWKIVPGTRQAQIARIPLAPKRSALRCTFGDGKDDAVAIEVDALLPNAATALRVELRIPAAIQLSVQPNLRSARGRPLAALEAKSASGPGGATLDWALPELAEEDRVRVAGLSVTLSTEADSASVFLDAVEFTF